MDTNDEFDIDQEIQAELDAITLDDPLDDIIDDDDTNEQEHEQTINETKRNLEDDMRERLAAFENEIKANFERYEIDYSEIDELLQKPSGENENDIQTNVARHCGIDREELDRILQSINAEASPADSIMETDSSEYEDQKIEIVKKSLPVIDMDQSVESSPREQEDPNKKQHDERLAESHRRMLDELALLDQRRKEEEERYAIVLQEQQISLAEEYRRLQETLDESARQTHNERVQFETLCREQESLTNERQNKMATLIQAWYRGKRVYSQYHGEILKRAKPALRTIAKKRKKKEQEELAKLQEIEENDRTIETTSIPLPSINRISLPDVLVVNKQSNEVQISQPMPVKVETTSKKKKVKQQTTVVSKPTTNESLLTTQIVQMENPADFIPTIIAEQRNISSPRQTYFETNKTADIRRVSSPSIQRPKSSNKRQHSAKNEPIQTLIITSEPLRTNETPRPSIENIPIKTVKRSDTFDKDSESSLLFSMESIPVIQPTHTIRPTSINRSDTFDKKSESSSPLLIESQSIDTINRSDTLVSKSESIPPIESNDSHDKSESLSVIKPIDTIATLTSSLEESGTIPVKSEIVSTPRVSTPRKAPVKERHPSKTTSSFLTEARLWAERTHDITYSNLLITTEETAQQVPTRKTGSTIRKLPDIDSQILTKAAKSQSSKEIRYLLLEHLLTPCSLSLISSTFPNLTHLTLRQCKLIQLVGLDSCSSLTVLDIEGNWLEQIHLQLNQLEYLNMSRNRLTSLLSINTPQLKYLNVSKNRLTRLNGIETFAKLNILLATSNQLLTTIGLQGCTHLLHIDVSDNHLVEMEQLDQCPLLITLKATSNALIQIPNLFNAILLHELDLTSNSLSSLDESSMGSWLPLLTHLRLSSNSLQELSSIILPSLIELELAFNQLSDVSMLKRFIKACPLLSHINLEQNPVLCDATSSSFIQENPINNPFSLLPSSVNDQSSESIRFYLNFLSNITSMFIKLRQTIEQNQTEPLHLIQSIYNQCQRYHDEKIMEPIEIPEPVLPAVTTKVLSPDEQSIIRLQACWRRRLIERRLNGNHRAARIIQARWRGYAVRRRMLAVRHLFTQHQTFDEIDLAQFDFDEAAFDARFQRPRTPVARVRHVWQPQHQVLSKTTTIVELPRPNSSHSSSAASSRAKPLIEPLVMPSRTNIIADEWGFTPSSSTAALMLKRAERMKWNVERKHKRDHMDAYQRLAMARNNEQPPGSLRLARRQPPPSISTKPIAQTKTLSPPSTGQSRSNRVFQWVHTQVAQFDDSSTRNVNSPGNERKRLPSLDGSTDAFNRMRPNDILQQQEQQQRWTSSTVSVRHPPPLLPPINGQLPRL